MLRHPHLNQPIFLRFPRPAIVPGRDGAAVYFAAQTASLSMPPSTTRSDDPFGC